MRMGAYYCIVGFAVGVLLTACVLWRSRGEHQLERLPFLPRYRARKPLEVESGGKFKWLVSYNVVLSASSVPKSAIEQTWANGIDHVNYYKICDTKNQQCLEESSVTAIEPHPLPRPLSVLLAVCDRERGRRREYQWYAVIDSSSYVRTGRLEAFLRRTRREQASLLGHCQFSRGQLPTVVYPSDAGLLVSSGLINLVCESVQDCKSTAKEAKSELTEEALWWCLKMVTNINCAEMGELFYVPSDQFEVEDLQRGYHHLNPAIERAVLYSPLSRIDHFRHLHRYLQQRELSNTLNELQQLQKEMRTLETILEQGNLKEDTTNYWTNNFKNKVPGSHSNSNYREAPVDYFGAQDTRGWIQLAEFDTINKAHQMTFKDSSTPKNSRVDGGKEFVQLHSEADTSVSYITSVNANGSITVKKTVKYFQPFSVVHIEESSALAKINVVVGVSSTENDFLKFLLSFESAFLARIDVQSPVGLLVVLFTNTGPTQSNWRDRLSPYSLVELLQNKYPNRDINLVVSPGEYSHTVMVRIALKYVSQFDILFLASPDIIFSYSFAHHCQQHVVQGVQLYFPALFRPFNVSAYYRSYMQYPLASRIMIDPELGGWHPPTSDFVCGYTSDVKELVDGGVTEGGEELDLMKSCVQHPNLTIFIAPEPALAYLTIKE